MLAKIKLIDAGSTKALGVRAKAAFQLYMMYSCTKRRCKSGHKFEIEKVSAAVFMDIDKG